MAVKKKTVKTKLEKAKWTFQGLEDIPIPEKAIGFVYKITVIGTPFYYFGKKNLTSTRGRGKKAVVKESTWRNYEGSSLELKELIKGGVKIKKEILEFAFSKSELTLKELQLIVCNGALTDCNSLNRWVSCKIFQRHLIKKEI